MSLFLLKKIQLQRRNEKEYLGFRCKKDWTKRYKCAYADYTVSIKDSAENFSLLKLVQFMLFQLGVRIFRSFFCFPKQ